jgi:nucleoredoxin
MSALEGLLGSTVLDGKGNPVSVSAISQNKKIVGLYFSAHWCPPCRGFTPQLAVFYEDLKEEQGDQFEVVFVSSDRDQQSWQEYFNEMPWLALPFDDRARKAALSEKYGVRGIPTLVILDGKTGKLITTDGRGKVTQDPKGFPWGQ